MNNNETIIRLEGVSKYFDQRRPVSLFRYEQTRVYALNDVSFSLRRGDFAAYAGPNGAGKSTTFKLLAGMLRPQQGMVRVFGLDPCADRIPVMRRTGVLFGNRSELWWDHPVRASFEWKKVVWEIEDSEYNKNVRQLMDLLELDDLWNTFARELSLGQRMRANLALTLLNSPELVLLDEPTLGLDVLAKRQMIDFLKRVNREQGVTLLVTSHDMDDLTEMARRILLINRGELAFDGGYDELIRMAGDYRLIRLAMDGPAPILPGAVCLGNEEDKYVYRYDAALVPVENLFAALANTPGVQDLELAREGIETVIARLYRQWGEAASDETELVPKQ